MRPSVVGENAIAQQSFQQPLDLRVAVARLHRDQREQTRSDRAERLAVDFDMRRTDALDQGDHREPDRSGMRSIELIPCEMAVKHAGAWTRASRRFCDNRARPQLGTRPSHSNRCPVVAPRFLTPPRPPACSWPVALLYGSLRIVGSLPLRVVHGFGAVLGQVLWLITDARAVSPNATSRL